MIFQNKRNVELDDVRGHVLCYTGTFSGIGKKRKKRRKKERKLLSLVDGLILVNI